jgi:hypothetical protein
MRARRSPSQTASRGRPRLRLDLRDLLSALAFNLALVGLAVGGARLAQTVIDQQVYGYVATPSAMMATRRGLEAAIGRLGPAGQEAGARWNALVAAQVQEGDLAAARGVILAAPAALPGDDAQTLRDVLPNNATDAAIIAAAAAFLDPGVRNAYRDLAAGAGGQNSGQSGAVFVLGDAGDLARDAALFAADANADPTDLALSAIGPALPASPQAVRGATVVRAALRTERLSPQLKAALRAAVEDATPSPTLRGALGPAFAAPPSEQATQVGAAFNRVLLERPYLALHAGLAEVGALSDTAGPATTALLLRHAQSLDDMAKLDLIARSGGDRAVAAAKLLAPGKPLLSTARRTLTWSQRLIVDVAIVLTCALVVFGLGLRTLGGMTRRKPKVARAPATTPILTPPTEPIL